MYDQILFPDYRSDLLLCYCVHITSLMFYKTHDLLFSNFDYMGKFKRFLAWLTGLSKLCSRGQLENDFDPSLVPWKEVGEHLAEIPA